MKDQTNTLGTLLSQFAPTGKVAEETLHAIVLGDADAIVVETKDGPRVYTLKDASELYRHLVERISDAAMVLEADGTILYCNGRLASMLGRGGLVGYCFLSLVKGDALGRARCFLASGGEHEASAELTLISAGGVMVPVRVAVAPMAFDDRPCIALVVTKLDDIAALKASEAALRESEERLLRTQEAGGIGCWDWDLATAIPVWSPTHFSLHGLDPASCRPSHESWLAAIHPDDRGQADGTLQAAIATGASFETDYRVVCSDGTLRWVTCRGKLERDAAGKTIRIRGVTLDTTERKQGEDGLKTAKAEAERAVLARSNFLAAASHDLRQPVQSLTLLMEVLKPHVTAPNVTKAFGMMGIALEGLNGLLTSILDLSRLDAGVVMPQVEALNIGALLGRLSLEYALLAGAKGLRVKTVGPALMVRTDPGLVERLLRNLIENAIRYTHGGGILLGVRRRGGYVRIDVVDSGIGIPMEKLPHIFEEFYQVGNSARDRNQGLGLGLSIVRRLSRLLGAELQVQSREGAGTCFSLMLPLFDGFHRPTTMAAGQEDLCGHILIIEDDAAVRSGLQLLAESWGHEVVAVASGEEALDLCAEKYGRFETIIADYRLGPGRNGAEAAAEIRKREGRPIPTLVVTGDTDPERISQVHASGFDILHKPVAAAELKEKLAQLLRGGGQRR